MKTRSVLAALFLGALLFAAVQPGAAQVGARVASVTLDDAAGRSHTLEQYAGKVVVLAFWSFKCPVSIGSDGRLTQIEDRYRDRGVVVLAVDSNSNESAAEIRRNVANRALAFPVLIDGDGVLAERLGATHTPSIFILDRGSVLRYRGGLDQNKQAAAVEEAIDAVLAGRAPAAGANEGGCPIRRKSF